MSTSNYDVTRGPGQDPPPESAAPDSPPSGRTSRRTGSDRNGGERPGAQIGNYKLLQQLGEGGFGVVWMAEQEAPVQRKVALKIIKLGMDTREVIARFEAERQALALMDHPHIARVLDAGTTETGRPFFVMELVRGDPVTDYCDRNNVSVEERLGLFVQVCQAVQHAHTKGIIHRDLKPSNVLVSTQDGKPHAKVIDFGIAKAISSRLTERTMFTEHRQLIGTPEYMSPEQAEGSLDIDTRTDVYSLGVLLYELLTGSTPFDGRTLRSAAYGEIQRIIREMDPPKPSTRLSTSEMLPAVAAHRHTEPRRLSAMLRGELDWIAMKALEKDRQRRYESASGLATDIQRYLSGEAVVAAPPSTVYRMRKFVRRNRSAVTAASLVAAALVVGVIGTSWGLVEARQQERVAEEARGVAERRLAQLEVGTQLLTGIFADLDLQRVKESGVPLEAELGDRLAKAAEQLDGEAVGDPLTVASLQERMGISLSRLGHAAPAAAALDKSAQTRRSLLGAEHPDTLTSLHHLAASYGGLGRTDEAIAINEEVVKLRTEALGAEHVETLRSMNNLSLLYSRAGRREEALALREDVLARRRATLGVDDPETLSSMQSLAGSYLALSRHSEALALLEEARVLQRNKLGPDHPRTLMSMATLASAYSMVGRHSEATSLYEETLLLQRARLGPDHPTTLLTMHNLASSLGDVGRHADSRTLYEQTLSLQRQKLGPDHPDTLATMGSLALSYSAVGQHAQAARLQEEVLVLQRSKLGASHPDTLANMANLATSYQALGRYSDALRVNEETMTLMSEGFGADDPNTLVSKHNLADIYATLGRHEEALRLREETAASFRSKLGPDHPYTLLSMGSRALSYYELGRVQEAVTLREEALDALKAVLGPDDPQTLKAMHNLAMSYLAAGRHEDALALSQQTLAARSKALGARHPDTLASVGAVTLCLEKLSRAPEALPILDAGFVAVSGQDASTSITPQILALQVIACHIRQDADGIRQAVEQMAATLPADHRSLFELACCTARLASTLRATDTSPAGQQQAQEAADKAIGLLKQAIAAGYRNVPYLEQEPALDDLRDQESFKAMLAELSPPQQLP